MDLNDLKNEIMSVPETDPVFIYVGVGVAAGMVNEAGHLPPENYQQFPPFLQDLHNQIPNLHLFLVLIDKRQECPPQVTLDYNCTASSANHYKNTERKLQVFTYNEYIYTDSDVNHIDQAINITEDLRDLNYFAIENHASLLYHDFSGRAVGRLAEYFENDQDCVGYMDQIVYGLSAREDHGCFFDLTQPHAFFPVRVERINNNHTRPIVKLFNYFYYIANNKLRDIDQAAESYPPQSQPLIKIQREQIINNIHTRFKNVNLSVLRQIKQLKVAQQAPVPEPAEQYIFNDLPRPYRDMFMDMYKEKEYDLIYEVCFSYSANELNVLAILKKMDISGQEMLDLITADQDPYKWYNNIKAFM